MAEQRDPVAGPRRLRGSSARVTDVLTAPQQLLGGLGTAVLALGLLCGLVITAVASLVGVGLSAVPLALLGIGFLGRPWPAGPVWLLPATLVTVAAIAFATLELPTRHLLRSPPALAADS